MDDAIEVRLFGQGSVRTANGDLVHHPRWRTVKNRDLFRLLSIRSNQVVPIDQVIEALWPDADPTKGRGSLRTAISQVRQVLGAAAIERVGGGLRAGPAWVDLRVYEARMVSARRLLSAGAVAEGIAVAKEAVALHTGTLVEDDPYSEWLSPVRDQIELAHGQFLGQVAAAALDSALLPDAIDFGQAALRHDGGDEWAAQIVMTATSRLGLSHPTRRVYASLSRTLAEEFGTQPSAATTSLYRHLTAESLPNSQNGDRDGPGDRVEVGDDLTQGWLLLSRHEQARTVLAPDEQGVLDVLAVAAETLCTRTIARLLGGELTLAQVRHATDTLDALGCIRSVSKGFELVHPALTELAYQWIRTARRRALHMRLSIEPELSVESRVRHSIAVGALDLPAPSHRTRPGSTAAPGQLDPSGELDPSGGGDWATGVCPSDQHPRVVVEAEARAIIEHYWPRRDLDRVGRFRSELAGMSRDLPDDDPILALAHWAAIDGCIRSGDAALHLQRLWNLWPKVRAHPDPEVASHGALVLGYALHELNDPRFFDFWDIAEIVTAGTSNEPLWHAASSMVWLDRGRLNHATAYMNRALSIGVDGTPAEAWTFFAMARIEEQKGAADAAHSLGLALDAARRIDDRLLLPELAARLAVIEAIQQPSSAGWHLALAEDTAGASTWYPRERAWILLAQAVLRRPIDPDQAELLIARAEAAARTAGLHWERQAITRAAAASLALA